MDDKAFVTCRTVSSTDWVVPTPESGADASRTVTANFGQKLDMVHSIAERDSILFDANGGQFVYVPLNLLQKYASDVAVTQ